MKRIIAILLIIILLTSACDKERVTRNGTIRDACRNTYSGDAFAACVEKHIDK